MGYFGHGYSVSVSVIPFPDSGFHVVVLPVFGRQQTAHDFEKSKPVYWCKIVTK